MRHAMHAPCSGICGFLAILTVGGCFNAVNEKYPLSLELTVIQRDLESPEYLEILKGMHNPWDLATEYARLNPPGGSADFAEKNGGPTAVRRDSELLAAYETRRRIETRFRDLLERLVGDRNRRPGAGKVAADITEKLSAKDAVTVTLEPVWIAPGSERNWPRWRGPGGRGISLETDLPFEWDATRNKNIVWKTPIEGEGNSSPVIWGDRIFLTTAFDGGHRKALVAIRRSDGELLFVRDAPATAPQKRIMEKAGYASSTPVVDGERVVAFLGNYGVVAFDLDGEPLWQHSLPPFEGSHGTAASPIIWKDLVILMQEQNGGPSLALALDKVSGDLRWSFDRPTSLGWCSPNLVRVNGEEQLVYGAHYVVVAYDPRTGDEIWHCGGPTKEVVPSLVFGHGHIYSSSGRSGPTLAIRPDGRGDVTETHLKWRSPRGGPLVPSPVLWKDLLYLVNDTGIVSCLDAHTGKKVYQSRLRGRFTSSAVAGDDKIYLTNEDGRTTVLRYGRELEILATNSLGEEVLASLAILDGQIFLRARQHLYCIGARRTTTAAAPRRQP